MAMCVRSLMVTSPDAAKWAALGLPCGWALRNVETGRPPEAIPPPLLKACNVRIVIGEFATWYHSAAYANAPEWVKIVPGMELYVADWMHYALGGD